MDGVRAIYERLWDEARPRYARGDVEPDARIDDPLDTRRGLSVILRPPEELQARLQAQQQAMQAVAGEQYFPAPAECHVTVLSAVSCVDDYALDHSDTEACLERLRRAAEGIGPITLEFAGITASSSCVMVQGFPCTDALQRLRERLRDGLTTARLGGEMESRYVARTAHMTVLRLRRALVQPEFLLDTLVSMRETSLGVWKFGSASLVFNDWYHRRENVVELARVAFGEPGHP